MKKRILFLSWTVGLGHITRDLAIANELRKILTDVKISWLSCPPALKVLEDEGEKVLRESQNLTHETAQMEENVGDKYRLNLLRSSIKWGRSWGPNLAVFKRVIAQEKFDLIIGDEAYEVVAALLQKKVSLDKPFLAIHDFFGVDPIQNTWMEKLAGYLMVSTFHRLNPQGIIDFIYCGEIDDILNKRFGFLLPNRRQWARKNCQFVGYILPFQSSEVADPGTIRKRLNYSSEPLVLCSIGGTAVGKDLLELCGKTYPYIRKQIPKFRMILVCGPRVAPESIDTPEGVEKRGYVPKLWEHLAACDLAIVQGGGTTTTELTVLRRPFIYFPLEEHFEQELHIAGRLERQGAGIKMRYSQTSPESLAQLVIKNLGKEVHYPKIPADGAKNSAQIVYNLLQSARSSSN
jgi:UDP:flavonoid glycosyltransferase YjiC (YdhE family)